MSRFGPMLAIAAALALLATPNAAAQEADAGDPLIVITGTAVVAEDDVVEGVFVAHADTTIDGTVTGDAVVVSGATVVTGKIEGDLTLISGPGRLLEGAEIEGDLIYGDERPEIAPGATVAGEVRDEGFEEVGDLFGDAFPLLAGVAIWIAVTVSALVLGIMLIAFAPRALDAASRRAREETGLSFALGAGAFVALPSIGFGAALTLVGLPLALAVLSALLPLAAVAYVTTAFVLGRVMLGEDADRFVAFLAGFAVLRLVALVPFLGMLAWLAAVIFGLGALVLATHRIRSGPEDYGTPPATA